MRLLVVFVVFALFGWLGTGAHAVAPTPPARPTPTVSPPAGSLPVVSPPPTRAGLLAWRLSNNPVHVTDHALREVRPDDAARIKALVARLNVPVFVVVEPELPRADRNDSVGLIPALYKRLRKNGIYLVTDPDGDGTARQYGGGLPVAPAWLTASRELPTDANAVRVIQRWVEILTAPDVNQRIKEQHPRPKSAALLQREAADRREIQGLLLGSAIGGVPLLVLLLTLRIRKAVRR